VRVQTLIALKADFPLPVLLQVARLARSTFFYHQARLQAPDPQEAIKTAVTEIFAKNRGRYGHRRIHTELVKQGWTVAKKTVLKLMRSLRLVCKVRRKRRYNSYQGGQGAVAPNVLNREFEAAAPNEKWVTDVTEALATLECEQTPLVHSDQGFQYQHVSWRNLLQGAGALQSMSRKGNCYDNAVMENFFGHLKEELFHRVRFISTDALAAALHEYIHWYNTDRISTKLEGLSPVQYRAQALAA
jgi:putative transposase